MDTNVMVGIGVGVIVITGSAYAKWKDYKQERMDKLKERLNKKNKKTNVLGKR